MGSCNQTATYLWLVVSLKSGRNQTGEERHREGGGLLNEEFEGVGQDPAEGMEPIYVGDNVGYSVGDLAAISRF